MATTNTTTAVKSFTKTPQAGDDTYAMLESDTDAVLLDVMSNDLGGASKTLWSLDDGDYLTDLLIQESVESVPSTSEMGVTITIVDGQVRYDISSAPQDFRNALESLAEGEVGYDTFTYAIRLGNGTLSWATVWVKFTGTNDAPVLAIDTSGGVTEDATAPDLTDSGALSITDVDATDTHVVSAAYNDDAAWRNGLVSAAQQISGTISTLVDSLIRPSPLTARSNTPTRP